MDSEPLPDHWKALGIDKSADTDAVKKAHRKLVLGCHPDKIKDTDPLKSEKLAQFHLVQKAYEVLTDPKEKATYEAQLTLEQLRKEKLARGGSTSSSREKTARFDVRTSGGASFQANGPSRYSTEERRPSHAYDDDDKFYDERDRERARASTRSRYDTYDATPKSGSSPRTEKESSRAAKATTDRSRAERTKARDKEERRERRFVSVESESSSADEKARHEAGYKRRSQEDEARRQADARRKTDDRRSYEDPRYATTSSARKMSTQEEEAIRYLHKSRAQVEESIRPSPVRTSSRDYYGGESSRSSRREARPETVRRSSARPKDRPASLSDRDKDRGYPEIVSWGEEDSSSRRPPTLKPYNSSPASIEIPRAMPQRAYTSAESSRDHRSSTSPPPSFHRSQTMPSAPHSSSRSKPATVSRPSTLREAMTPEHTSPDTFQTVPPPQPTSASKTMYYHYPAPGGVRQEDIPGGGHRTVLREPERQRHHSPEPLSRPPIGANRPSEANISKAAASPPLGRTASRIVSPVREERGRSSRPLYGEVSSNYSRPRAQRQASYSPNDVQYAHKYGPEDVKWAPRGRENDRGDYPSKPTLGRTATYVY